MKHRTMQLRSTISGILLSSSSLLASSWSFEIEPYLLMATMKGDAKIAYAPSAAIDMDFGDILENLDAGAMIHFEMRHENSWGVWLDYGFMDLSSDIAGPVNGVISASMRQGTLEAMAMYRIKVGMGTIDYLMGIRWWDNDIGVTHSILNGKKEVKEDWIDPVVGARWMTPISNKWKFMLLGTVGGFGVESELSTSGAVGVKYEISDLLELDLQYKALWADYNNGAHGSENYFEYNAVTYGPIIGLNFRW